MRPLYFGAKLLETLHQQCSIDATVGIGSVRADIEGIRRSYYEAVFASTYHKKWGNLCHFEDLKILVTEGKQEAPETFMQTILLSVLTWNWPSSESVRNVNNEHGVC